MKRDCIGRRASMTAVVGLVIGLASSCATGPERPANDRLLSEQIPPAPPASAAEEWSVDEPLAEEEPSVDPALIREALASARLVTDRGLEASAERAVGWWTLPSQPDYRTILSPDRSFETAISMGTTSTGVLINAVQLDDEGDYHSIIERHRRRGTSYGTPELIEIVQRAANIVGETHGGAPLRLGNMSRRGGGDIPWSHSHNSGRDADLAFYVMREEDGASVPAPDLMHFSDDGVAKEDPSYRFDVERNWTLVKSLVTDETTTVQWIFVSDGLKQMLLRHARDVGEDEAVISRAEDVLHQPTDAPPHDDHFHLRVACPLEDRLVGCVDYGPKWEWADWHEEHLLAQAVALMEAFEDDDASVRLQALEFLDRIKSPFRAEIALVRGVWDPSPAVRQRALEVARTSWTWSVPALVNAERIIASETTATDEKISAYSILRRSKDPLSRDFAMRRVSDDGVTDWEKVYAARALSHFMEPALVPFIIDQLESQSPAVQQELSEVLHRITNHSRDVNWAHATAEECEETTRWWWNWWEKNRGEEREVWLLRGFARHGISLDRLLTASAVDEIMPLLKSAPTHVVYNVNRVLRKVTGRWSSLEQLDGRKLYRYWSKWWLKNKWRLVAAESNS